MKKIGITNHPDFPLEEWLITTINLDDLFETPIDLTTEEVGFANAFMELVNLNTDDDDGLIELVMKPSSLKSFSIHMKRYVIQNHNKRQSKNNL